MSKTHLNKSINCLLKEKKKQKKKNFKNLKAFIRYSQKSDDVYENLEDVEEESVKVFDYIIAHMESVKKLIPIVTKLLLRGIKLNILLAFISQYYFKVTKTIRLNVTHYFIINVPNKKQL